MLVLVEVLMRPDLPQRWPQLWSERDRGAALACREALTLDDLLGALFAIEGTHGARRAACRATLVGWAEAVALAAETQPPLVALRAVLAPRLVSADPFRARPAAGAVSRVVAGEPGLPGVLSALWWVVGRWAGLTLCPVALPGRVALADAAGRLIDPGAGGAPLDRWDLERIRRAREGEPPPAGGASAQIIDRALRDLLLCGELAHDDVTCFRAVSFLSLLHPDAPGPLLAQGLVAEDVGALAHAEALYARVLDRFPGSHEAAVAQRRLTGLQATPRQLH